MTILLARIYRFFHVLHTNVFPIYSISLQLNCTTVEKFDQLTARQIWHAFSL